MRKASILLMTLLVASVAPPAQADQWNYEGPRDLVESKKIGTVIIENDFTGGLSSSMMVLRESWNFFWCEVVGQFPCNERDGLLSGKLVLPVCNSPRQENCLEGLFGSTESGELVAAELIGQVAGATFAANPKYGLPIGSTASKWRIPGLVHQGGTDTYLVSVDLRFYADFGKKANFDEASILIAPYFEQTGFFSPVEFLQEFLDGRHQALQAGPSGQCVWQEEGVCGVSSDFASGHRFKLDFRINNKIGGWFSGRVTKPEISVTRHSASANRISISAEPVSIQRVAHVTTREQATPEFIKEFGQSGDFYFGLTPSTSTYAFDAISAMREQVKDTSTGVTTSWYLETTGSFQNSCLSDKSRVNGIVTTNATAYQGTAPEFKRGFLDYKVAGMHYEPDGVTKSLGTYDLVMRSDVARCLYGLSKAPVSATITVAGDGDTRIATTVVGEKGGWLKLAAYGFTFSEKTIKVKISQAKRTTITCVSTTNSKKIRKVTAINPKCPIGFRKK